MKKWAALSKQTKGKIVAGWLVGSIAIIGGSVMYVQASDYKANVSECKKVIEAQSLKIEKAQKIASELYHSDKKDFLKKGMTLKDVKEFKAKVYCLKDKESDFDVKKEDLPSSFKKEQKEIAELKTMYEDVKMKFIFQQALNQTFEKVVLDGDQLDTTISVKTSSKQVDIESEKKALQESTLKDTEFAKKVEAGLNEALGQLKQNEVSKKAVSDLYEKEKVKANQSMDSYKKAKVEVEKVKNMSLKQELNKKLEAVKAQIEKESKAKAETEAKKNGGTVKQNADGTYSTQAPVVAEPAQTTSNTGETSGSQAAASQSSSNSNNATTSGTGTYTGGSTSANTSSSNTGSGSSTNTGGTSSNTNSNSSGGSSSSNGSNTWNGNQTGGGNIADHGNSNGATGGGNTWTGGEFNPGDLDW